jgi:hypothetical protein
MLYSQSEFIPRGRVGRTRFERTDRVGLARLSAALRGYVACRRCRTAMHLKESSDWRPFLEHVNALPTCKVECKVSSECQARGIS